MKPMLRLLISVLVAALLLPAVVAAHPHIIDAKEKVEVDPDTLLEDLRKVQVIFMGEFHDNKGHHQAQLSIIDALDDDEERPLAVGLEMFRQESQDILDRWTEGKLSLLKFLSAYRDNWSMWEVYREIFIHARNEQVKLVGLNIPREITQRVAKSGFASLPDEERQMLGNVQCQVSPLYGTFIRQAMGVHDGHGRQFLYFCEAQLLWDTMMARRLVDFLKENPDYRVVVLAGSGHAWKFGIPRQMLEEVDITYRVILPEVFERVDRMNVNDGIADYLWLDVGDDGWKF